jgi:hypothetical protein
VTRLVLRGSAVQDLELMLWCSGCAGRHITVEVPDARRTPPEGTLKRVRQYIKRKCSDEYEGGSWRVTLMLGHVSEDDSDID